MSESELLEYEKGLASAQLVQRGLLPKNRHFLKVVNSYFVLYRPKDVVSGDFYWVGKRNGLSYVVVGDCTGHGIAGALCAVLAMNLFEYAIMNKGIKSVSKILQEVDKRFIESFKDDTSQADVPWIDLALVAIDERNRKVHYATANRKILRVGISGQQVFQGERYPLGGWQVEHDRRFQSRTFEFEPGEMIYLGSDGFQDQFGGPENKKYKSSRLHEFLSSIAKHDAHEQFKLLEDELDKWISTNIQTDDICLLGVRL